MNIGEMRAALRHLDDDTARRFTELDERIATQEVEIGQLREERDATAATLERMEAALDDFIARKSGTKPKATGTTAETLTPPARKSGERSDAWSKRLTAWAETNGVDAPPKPRALDNANTYDARVQKWSQETSE